MGFVATILSHDEAMALPQKDRPLNYRVPGNIYHAVFETVGAASLCWTPKPSTEVFNPEEAEKVALRLLFCIADELERLGVTSEQIRGEKKSDGR